MAVALEELVCLCELGARFVKAMYLDEEVAECSVRSGLDGGEVGLVCVGEGLACEWLGGVLDAVVRCDASPECVAGGKVDDVLRGAELFAFERKTQRFIGLAALVQCFRKVDQCPRAKGFLPELL